MTKPLISIIIPVYNSGEAIRRITGSILAQQTDFELILVDDGSSDHTPSVLKQLSVEDKRVRVFTKKNGGPSSARNAGIDISVGEYIIFFDADDDIHPQTFKNIPDTLRSTPSDLWVFGWTTEVRQDEKILKGKTITPDRESFRGSSTDIKKFVIRSIGGSGQLYNLWNKVYRADIIQSNHIRFREDIRFGEDLVFTLHYARHVRQIELYPDALYQYQANSLTSVFSSSALSHEYRAINAKELDEFAGDQRDEELDDLTGWVHWRWLISYSLILSKSKLSSQQRVGSLAKVLVATPKVAKSAHYIGQKRLLTEKLYNMLRRSPRLMLGFAKIANNGKRLGTKLAQFK